MRSMCFPAAADPRSGELVWSHSGFMKADKLIEALVNFAEKHSLTDL